MQITRCGQLIYLMSKSKKIKVWYCRFRYTSNAQIIKASKLLISIGNFNKVYNPTKIYSDFKQFNNNSSNNKTLVFIAKVLLLTVLPDNNFDSLCTLYIISK